MAKKAVFNVEWLKNDSFSPWIEKCQNDIHSAYCVVCKKAVGLSNMGVQALRSHTSGKKHQTNLASKVSSYTIKSFTRPSAIPSETQAQPPSKPSGETDDNRNSEVQVALITKAVPSPRIPPSTMDSFLLKENTTKAEIIWSLNCVWNHLSMLAGGQSTELFKMMFPDSKIAQDMKLQRAKLTYTIVYGLGPLFHEEVVSDVIQSELFAISFDESLNKVSQEEQMDLIVRYWCNMKNLAVCRYMGSAFLGHTRAIDLLQAFREQLAAFDLTKMIQVSMDGPNTNLKFLADLKKDLQESPDSPLLLDFGSCGIHTLHNAFKVGVQASGWHIIEFLRAIYNLFKNSPARKADYIRYTGSRKLPKKFCGTRWLQNVNVAERALEVLPNLKKYVKGVRDDKKEPKSATYSTVIDHLKDPLLGPKLSFFQSIAAKVEPYLELYQKDQPMVPFLYSDICQLLRVLMGKFVKKEILDKEIIIKIDISLRGNLIDAKQVELGYATRGAIKESKNLSQKDILLFRNECLTIMQKMTSKIIEKSPVKYKIVKGLTFCDPEVIVKSQTVSLQGLKTTLENFVQLKRLTGRIADKIERDFRDLCSKPVAMDRFRTFSRQDDRLDGFWMETVSITNGSDELKKFLRMIFILFHGNANVERGFSINKECLIENQSQRSLVAIKHVWDHLNHIGGVKHVSVNKKMIHAARNARSRYMEKLDEDKAKAKKASEKESSRKRTQEIVKELTEKKRKLMEDYQKNIDSLDEQIGEVHKK